MLFLAVVCQLMVVCQVAVAEDEPDYTQWVTLTNSDSTSSSTFSFQKKTETSVNNWSDGEWPTSGKDYYVPAGRVLMTVSSGSSNADFKGRHLAVAGRVVHRSSPGSFKMGAGGILLPGGAIRIEQSHTGISLAGRVSIESTREQPADLQLNKELKKGETARGIFNISGYLDGAADTAIRLYRSAVQSVLPVPDSTYYVNVPAFTNYFGDVRVTRNIELLFVGSFARQEIPGTLQLDPEGYFTVGTDNSTITVGTLAAAGGVLRVNTSQVGETNPLVITNALTFVDEAKLHVTFGTWLPKAGAQKYPILKLTGPAASSSVTPDDFALDIETPLWRDLPKTGAPQIAVDETAEGKVISVSWPDEPTPWIHYDAAGNLVLDAQTAYGTSIDGLVDGETGALSVIKEGPGTALVGPTSSFTGALDVRAGTLEVGNPDYAYYRWVIRATYTRSTSSSKYRVIGLKSFGLFDAEGNDRVYCQSHEGDWVTTKDGYYQSYAYPSRATDPAFQEGHFRITKYSGTVKSYTSTENAAVSNLFAHSSWTAPNFWSRTPAFPPVPESNETWTVITMRLTPGTPVRTWDYVNATYNDSVQMISNCTLEASLDCQNWTELAVVDNPERPTKDMWQGSKEAYEAGFTTHTGGMPIVGWPQDPIAYAASKVSVAAGATLEARTGTAPVLDNIEIDVTRGLGTLRNFAAAETGTLRIVNAEGARSLSFAADLTGLANAANLAGWTILVDGQDMTRVRTVTVSADGLSINPRGLILLLR